jgi:hypothetical protein
MTADDFQQFCTLAKTVREWKDSEIAIRLGVSVQSLRNWKRNGAPLYIGLACTTLSEGWSEWTYEDGGRPDLATTHQTQAPASPPH